VWVWAKRLPDDLLDFRQHVSEGRVLTCAPVVMELLYSAQRPDDFHRMRDEYATLTTCPIGPAEWARALEIYGLLADQGPLHQRQVGHADLLIAAAAESAGIPVIHYDGDFDLITEVSGIDTRWVRPRGSLE
jgi:predicted nucleic acid-binding protein